MIFVDTNIWLYAFIKEPQDKDKNKHTRCNSLLNTLARPVISEQVIGEVCVNLLKKAKWTEPQLLPLISSFYSRCNVVAAELTSATRMAPFRSGQHAIK